MRRLREDERDFLAAMIASRPVHARLASELKNLTVEEMSGGMGDFRFLAKDGERPRLGHVLAEADFDDADGVPVTVTLNLDDRDRLYELEVWKGDFSSLKRFPDPKGIAMRGPRG